MKELECASCNKRFESVESLEQHNSAKHGATAKKNPINFRKYIVFALIGAILIFSILAVKAYYDKPGDYNEFAKCLTSKGAIIYGNDFCSYTNKQLNFFGKSKSYLNYIKCFENKELCDQKEIKLTPTWEIDGKMYTQVQTFETLSAITGCKI
ncbi:hypothetical protein J4229_02475 [Candidatus Pacearchaeota archaeon]|nr:hypothetical protein [Candidatus Pacearchaeota archaeon]